MILAIASGKGGTGKTTVAVNLALTAPGPVQLLDCDVEEPNCHIFLKPHIHARAPVGLPVPAVDEATCNACGECGRVCQYHAIVSLKSKPLIFADLCHGCGGCAKVCPTGAISEVERRVGVVETGTAFASPSPCVAPVAGNRWQARSGRRPVEFVQGRLDVGHPMSPLLIRAVKRRARLDALTIIDCPPGTSCPVITAVRRSDCVLLVTEPTPFGLNDLTLAVETVRQLGLRFGVVLNRADIGDGRTRDYCAREAVPILLEIPDDRRVAEAYSRGEAMVEALPEYANAFQRLWLHIEGMARNASPAAGRTSHAQA